MTRDGFINIQFCAGRSAFLLALLFCLQLNVPDVRAQGDIEGKKLSSDPLIIQMFDPAKNETNVKVVLGTNMSADPLMTYTAPVTYPIQSGLNLGWADYVYEGRAPSGKQGVIFTFFLKREDAFKTQPAFSISAEGQELLQGVAELPDAGTKGTQSVTLRVPTEIFLRVARAKKVQFKLGPKVYKPVGFQRKYMRALAKIIDPQGK
jgi:hypothetical protein